ncbi:MAG: hypothetical protein ACPGRX_05750 [Bdellovibrionales bacterium]
MPNCFTEYYSRKAEPEQMQLKKDCASNREINDFIEIVYVNSKGAKRIDPKAALFPNLNQRG